MESSTPSFRNKSAPGSPAVPPEAVAPTERLNVRQKVVAQARSQKTRRTVDLSPATHRALDVWQREAADRLGVARVTGQEVLTALIDELLADPKLSAQVTRRIQDRR
jgi:hypothetical protein